MIKNVINNFKKEAKMNKSKENSNKSKVKKDKKHDSELIEKLTNIPKLDTDAPNPPVPNRAHTEM